MQLNIYLISHPIIKLLSNTIIEQEINDIISINYYQKIGLLLIYEVTRKLLKIQNTYIKRITGLKTLSLIDAHQKFYIFTNISNTYLMLTDVKLIIPNANIINFDYNNHETYKNISNEIMEANKQNITIIILDKILQQSHSMELIRYINKSIPTPINRIHIACIACYDKTLKSIGQTYPELNIYTTQIIP